MQTSSDDTIVVVGGGLAGLATAAYLARAGAPVTVLERAAEPGGRAQTTSAGAVPHEPRAARALSRRRRRRASCAELGVTYSRRHAVRGRRLRRRPRRAARAARAGSSRCSPPASSASRAKLEIGAPAGGLASVDADAARAHAPCASGCRATSASPTCARSSRRSSASRPTPTRPSTMSAGSPSASSSSPSRTTCATSTAAGRRWSTGCARAPSEHGARRPHRRARSSSSRAAADGARRGVRLRTGEIVPAAAVRARARRRRRRGAPARRRRAPRRAGDAVAGARRLPRRRRSPACRGRAPPSRSASTSRSTAPCTRRSARLAPEGGALIHVAKYLGDDTPDPRRDERQLEGLLDLLQPGWRDVVVERRFLPRMVAASALATAAGGGCRGAPRRRTSPERPASTSPATGSGRRAGSPTPAWRARAAAARARRWRARGQRGAAAA